MSGTNTLVVAGNSGGVPSVFNAAAYEQLNGTIQSSQQTESKQTTKTNSAVTFSRFRVKVKTNTDATGRTVNFRKNTATGNQTISITGSTTGNFTDVTHTDSLAAGDTFDVNRPSDTVNGTSLNFIYMQANNTTPLAFYSNGATTTVGHIALSTTTQYAALFGYTDANATEANQQVKHESAGTLQNLSTNVDTSSTGTTTITHRKNTANGNQTLSISSGTTGIAQDTTHIDSLSAGDLLATSFVSTNSSGNFEYIAYEFAGTSSAHMLAGRANGNISFSGSVTRYHPFAGDVTASISAEASAQMSTDFAATFSKLRCHIQTNTSATATMVFRSATVTQNQTVSVTSGGTGWFEDTTHSDSIAANTTVNAQIVTGSVTSLLWLETAVTTDDGSNTGSTDATGSGSIPTLTLTAPTGTANADATGSGSIPTLTLTAPTGAGAADETASGSIPTLTLTAPTGTANADEIGSGSIPTLTLTAPSGSATTDATGSGSVPTLGVTPPDGVAIGTGTGQGSIPVLTINPPAYQYVRVTQMGLNVLNQGEAKARVTQMGLAVSAAPDAKARVTQMGLLVLASGGETPLQPNPLSLQDFGRDQVVYQRLVNMYVEPTPQGPGQSARYPRPGLYPVAVRGGGPVRKTFTWHGFRFTVSGGSVFRDDIAIGNVPSTRNLRFAFSDEEVVLISGGAAWYVNNPDQTGATISQITDPDLPPNVIDVAFLAGRFVYITADTAQFYYSEVGDARNIDGLNFATAAENTADHIVAVSTIGDNLVFFCGLSLEWWYPVSDPNNPFYRSPGRRNDKGLAAQETVVEADNTLFFLGNDRMVYRALAVPLRVSDFSVEDKLRRVSLADLPSCSAVSLSYGGHSFFVLHLPGQGTWALDIGQKRWYQWESYGKPFWRVQCADKEGFIGDMYSGNILGLDGKHFYDMTADPVVKVVSTYVKINKGYVRNFNLLLSCSRGVGVATGQGSNPIVEMRFSDNEGRSWSSWIPAPLGRMGDGSDNAKALWTGLGAMHAPGRLFEFRCSDPVFFAPWEVRYNEERL